MCEALGNPPFGHDPPPIWLPKWEEGVKATIVAVVRRETYPVGASNSTVWPASSRGRVGSFAAISLRRPRRTARRAATAVGGGSLSGGRL